MLIYKPPHLVYLTLFFESIIFPTIVALGMRGLGKYSKRGSGFIVGGVCGGAVVPPLLFVASDRQGAVDMATGHAPTAVGMSVPLAFFIAAWSYSLAVNFVPAYRDVADKFSTTEIGVVGARAHVDEEGGGEADGTVLGGKDGLATEERREAVDFEPKI
jgi:FHS family L-fucose permease-like MFS transporter